MKNWKCIIGATILTPFAVALFLGICIGITFVITSFTIVAYVTTAIVVLFIVVVSWIGLYEHCKEYWAKKGKINE